MAGKPAAGTPPAFSPPLSPTLSTPLSSPLSPPLSIPLSIPLSPPQPQEDNGGQMCHGHLELAAQFMNRARTISGNPAHGGVFTYKEAQKSLTDVIADTSSPASPELIQGLLEYGASPNIARRRSRNLFKRLIGKDQEDRRSYVLVNATQNTMCSVAVLETLLRQADDVAKNEAFRGSFSQPCREKIHILLAAGVDASTSCDEFQSAVRDNDQSMVCAFLNSSKGPCQPCRNSGLVTVVGNGCVENVRALAQAGANLGFQNGAAICKAVESGNPDLVAAIVSPTHCPAQNTLDVAVRTALTVFCGNTLALLQILRPLTNGAVKPSLQALAEVLDRTVDSEDRGIAHDIAALLFWAGVRGEPVANALVKVINCSSPDDADSDKILLLVNLLLEKGNADINSSEGQPLIAATMQGQCLLLAALLRHGPSVSSLNAALTCAMQNLTGASRLDMITALLKSGAKGPPVDQMLCTAAGLGIDGLPLTSVLLRYSSVDCDGGSALVYAVRSRCLEQISEIVGGQPTPNTLAAAWAEVDSIEDDEFQLVAYKILLPGEVTESVKDRSLIAAVRRDPTSHLVCRFLLDNQASAERSGGECIVTAAARLDMGTLQLLSLAVESKKLFSAALKACTSTDNWFTPSGLEVISFLLSKEPSDAVLERAFCRAASLLQLEALDLLISSICSGEAVNKAFMAATEEDVLKSLACDPEKVLAVVDQLMQWGASGEAVDKALVKAVAIHGKGIDAEKLIDILFSYEDQKPDVNYSDGAALLNVPASGNTPLLKKLASHGATKGSLSLVFASVLGNPQLSENTVLAIIDVLVGTEGEGFDVNDAPKGFPPPIIGGLWAHPHSVAILKRLVKLGCHLEAKHPTTIYQGSTILEPVTALAWALSRPGRQVGSKVIKALITSKANVKFVSPQSKATPLILAAKYGRNDVLPEILQAGAEILHKDGYGRSALFYASAAGDTQSVKALVKAKALTNDGSLHEAARLFHSETVRALLQGGHNPDFPSTLHQGRGALQELALRCDGEADITMMEATIAALVEGKAKPMTQHNGRNVLFLALDNDHPLTITQAIIDRAMWEYLNDESNVYQVPDNSFSNNEGDFLSASMYVLEGYSSATTESQISELYDLLKSKGCIDRLYAGRGSIQPPNAVGLPKAIFDDEEKRRGEMEKRQQKEAEHKTRIRHEQELAYAREGIESNKHGGMLHRNELTYRQQDVHERQTATRAQELAAATSEQKRALQFMEDTQKQKTAIRNEQIKLNATAAMDHQKQTAQLQQSRIKTHFEEQSNNQKLRHLQDKEVMERRGIGLQREQLQMQSSFAARANQQKIAVQKQQNRLTTQAARAKYKLGEKQANSRLVHKRKENRESLAYRHQENREKLVHNRQMNQEKLRTARSTGMLEMASHQRKMEMLGAQQWTQMLKAANNPPGQMNQRLSGGFPPVGRITEA